MDTKLKNIEHGDFVAWKRPDGTTARGRVAKFWAIEMVGKPTAELMEGLSQEDLAEVKRLADFGPLGEAINAVLGKDLIEEAWQEFIEKGKVIEVPDFSRPPALVYIFFELRPGKCECGCGGVNYLLCEYSPIRYMPASGNRDDSFQPHGLN